jgi:hypothetical protein
MSKSRNQRWSCALALAALFVAAPGAQAKPPAPGAFCEVYPEAPACVSGQAACETCHVQTPALNLYGTQLSGVLAPAEARPLSDEVFVAGLPEALRAIEALDADGDGAENGDELAVGTSPSDARDVPGGGSDACARGAVGIEYDVCGYDPSYVYKKLHIDFCGYSPTLEQKRAFGALGRAEQMTALHDALDACLDSENWIGRDGVVWNLANKKIGPIAAIKSGEDAGPIPLADYLDDYAYFVYTQIDGHDAREVLTGQYFVKLTPPSAEEPSTTYSTFVRDTRFLEDYTIGQGITNRNQRAGLLTHRWFLMSQIMFTAIPRTAAAHAYRAFLGKDISRLEGLSPIENEPVDYDAKDVAAPECAVCHSTLDPLTYPFTRYEGIGGGDGSAIPFQYNNQRLARFVSSDGPDVTDAPEQGYVLGQPVATLVEWGEVAANSDEFAQATTRDYWRLLMGEAPRASEVAEFDGLWRALKTEHTYSVEAMLHDMIETEAYGVP